MATNGKLPISISTMRDKNELKVMCVHAHFDDFEFTAGGLFSLWKRRLGDDFKARVLVCTDGSAGHHVRSPGETATIRLAEQEASARVGGYESRMLVYPDGSTIREACLLVTTPLLAALWKAIRDFQPDYLFCPPIPVDPLAGVHVDHLAVAEAVRKVAYMINVPHAFLKEYPDEPLVGVPVRVPVILNVYDGYMAGHNAWDFAVDTEETFETVAEMSFCHQSQIMEWLPWVGRHKMKVPEDFNDWRRQLRERMNRQQTELGLDPSRAMEVFTVTAWGEIPDLDRIQADFPPLEQGHPNWNHFIKKLERFTQR